MSKQILHMRMDAALKEELKRRADEENRTLSNLIEKVLKDYASKQERP